MTHTFDVRLHDPGPSQLKSSYVTMTSFKQKNQLKHKLRLGDNQTDPATPNTSERGRLVPFCIADNTDAGISLFGLNRVFSGTALRKPNGKYCKSRMLLTHPVDHFHDFEYTISFPTITLEWESYNVVVLSVIRIFKPTTDGDALVRSDYISVETYEVLWDKARPCLPYSYPLSASHVVDHAALRRGDVRVSSYEILGISGGCFGVNVPLRFCQTWGSTPCAFLDNNCYYYLRIRDFSSMSIPLLNVQVPLFSRALSLHPQVDVQ